MIDVTDLIVPPWVRFLAVLALVAAIFGAGYWTGTKLENLARVAEVATLNAAHAKASAKQEGAAREASEAYRAKEQQWARERAERETQHAAELKAMQARAAAVAAATAGLRNDLRAAAAACGAAADDPVTACRAYAAALGELLAEYRSAGLQVAQAAEEHAADVRRLLAEWPR